MKPSPAQRKVLEAMRDGELREHYSDGRTWFTYAGLSRGHPVESTVKAMIKAAWITRGKSERVCIMHSVAPYTITKLGRAALERA